MIKQKQSRLDNVEKRIAAMTNVIQSLMDEINNLKTMSFGQYELIKQFKDYDNAIELLKEKAAKSDGETPEAKASGKDSK